MATNKKSPFTDKKMLGRAVKDSFIKLNPKTQVQNPVMLLVYISAILTTILWIISLFGLKDASSGYTLTIAIILWFTVLFANFAEAIAEGRGKAQADSLRAAKKDVEAYKIPSIDKKENISSVSSSMLKKGDLVIVRSGAVSYTHLECHKRDIGVTAYFNAVLNQANAMRHKEWTVGRNGGSVLDGNPRCYNTCYGDYLVNEVREVLDMYPDVDGIFIDCLDLTPPCYGPECLNEMLEEGIDIRNDAQVRIYDKRKKINMAKRLRDIIPHDKYYFVNGLKEILDDSTKINKDFYISHSEIESIPSVESWGFDCFPTLIAHDRNLYGNTLYMTGRFHYSWGDFGGIRTEAALEYDAFTSLAFGSQISIGDHLHPRGRIEKGLADMIKNIYAKVEKVEKWTDDAEYVPEIGVFCPISVSYTHLDVYKRQTFYRLPPWFCNPTGLTGQIGSIYTIPEYRRMGIANKILDNIINCLLYTSRCV